MVRSKQDIALGVGVLSILSALFVFIYMALNESFCNLQESCVYTPYVPAGIFAASLFVVGLLLILIGVAFHCGRETDAELGGKEL